MSTSSEQHKDGLSNRTSAINNPNLSSETKEAAKEKLEEMK